MSNELGDIRESLGRIEQKIDGVLVWIPVHVASDQRMADDIKAIQIDHAKQRGAAKVWSLLGATAGAILGAVGSYFGNRGR
jgi:hypothetical protein